MGKTTGTDGSRDSEGSDEGYGVRREGFLAALDDDDAEEAVVDVACGVEEERESTTVDSLVASSSGSNLAQYATASSRGSRTGTGRPAKRGTTAVAAPLLPDAYDARVDADAGPTAEPVDVAGAEGEARGGEASDGDIGRVIEVAEGVAARAGCVAKGSSVYCGVGKRPRGRDKSSVAAGSLGNAKVDASEGAGRRQKGWVSDARI